MMKNPPTLATTLILLAASLLAAEGPCTSPEHRQFDFWLGTWEVRAAARPDAPPARNVITSKYNGCVVREEYDTPSGYAGTSLSFYDANTKTWHQTWIDNQGQPLYLNGGREGASMVMYSDRNAKPLQRITWTPAKNGTVRQLWQSSKDGGTTWKTVFDGTYTKAGKP